MKKGVSLYLTPLIGRRKEAWKKNYYLKKKEEISLPLIEEKGLLLENVRKRKTEGLIIKSRAKCVEEGEKPTRCIYFCNLKKRNY